jgi:hypothetical protein
MPDNPAHQRVRYHRGSACGYPCVDCGDIKKHHEWSQIRVNGKYLDSEDINSYESRCCACHYEYDGKNTDHLHKPEFYQGEKSSQHKLTEDDIHQIRRLLKAGHSQQAIADIFDVHQVTISSIKLGKTWGWLESEVIA